MTLLEQLRRFRVPLYMAWSSVVFICFGDSDTLGIVIAAHLSGVIVGKMLSNAEAHASATERRR